MKTTYEVIQDDGGNLYLVVFDESGECIYCESGYEMDEARLLDDIQGIKDGLNGWVTTCDPVEAYETLTSHEYGWEYVTEQYS